MQLDKSTQIILALGVVAVGGLAVVEFSNGFNNAESSVGTGSGVGLAIGIGLVGLGLGTAAVIGLAGLVAL